MPRTRALGIARAYLPANPWGNRWDYYYVRAKLGSDPLYPGVLRALRGSTAPVLDLGCGLGLLAHALRQDGQAMAYLGVDNDAAKIRRAGLAADRMRLADARFEYVDLARGLPAHAGSVAILDVLQYLPAAAQRELLLNAVAMLSPGARLVIRSGMVDGSWRGRVSRIGDRVANLVGWMQSAPRCHPDAGVLRATLEGAGLQVAFEPLYGRTPFNNWLVVASHSQAGIPPRDAG
ncbi:MAG TPA: methyltransferase domain-containing protein [Luteimonas sp.]|nr:methyltransferase domain-containing protein [Luteimonas sp.]